MTKPKFTAAQVIDAIRKAQTAAGAARILSCDSGTIRNYAKRHPTVNEALYQEREDLADYGEMGLKRAVLAGESWAIALTVRTLGKNRGYTERQEVTGLDGLPLNPIKEVVIGGTQAPGKQATGTVLDEPST